MSAVRQRARVIVLAGLALVAAYGGMASGGQSAARGWPQFRGPARDGSSSERGLARSWTAAGPRVVWKRALGDGFSAVTVVGDTLFTMFADGQQEVLVALRADTGAELWRSPAGERFVDEFGDGPRSTPTVDGDRVYALSSKGQLLALKVGDGSKLWSVDLVQQLGGHVPRWGYSGAPLVDGDLLLLPVGGGAGKLVYALDKKTGATRWSALDGEEVGYSSPIAVTIDGVRQYVLVVQKELVALRADGQVHWRHPWEPGAIATPLFLAPDRIFVSAAADAGALMLRVRTGKGREATAQELWHSRGMKNHFNASVAVGGHIYGFDNASFKCLSAATGEPSWVQRGLGKGSLIVADGLLYALGDQGQLVLVEAKPDRYVERGRVQALAGKSWTAPALADGRLFLRDQKELVCLQVAG